MSKNTTTTSARLDALESRFDRIEGLLERIADRAVTPAASQPTTEPTAKAGKAKAAKAGKAAKGGTTAVVVKVSNRELRAALKAHKAAGKIRAGVTVANALAEGLMLGDGTLPGSGKKAGKGKGGKAAGAKADKPARTQAEIEAAAAKRQAQFEAFRGLQTALREHKEAGLIRKGITVKEAIAEGLMDEQGNALCEHGLAEVEVCAEVAAKDAAATKAERKAAKKARKAAKQAAALEPEAPARTRVTDVAPRRADGTITPKEEWADRERLALTGEFDRFEIDAIIADKRERGEYANA